MKKLHLMSILALLLIVAASGCATNPGGIAASSTPINGRSYTNLGRSTATERRILLLGIIPITGENSIRGALNEAVENRGGDAMINITVESYAHWWIIITRFATRVDGEVIRFDK